MRKERIVASIFDFMFLTFLTYALRLGTLKPSWTGLLPNLPNLPYLFPIYTCTRYARDARRVNSIYK